ncbi:MAG: YraN family protein [Candidatus Paracaedimonas acanthamoebae]|uniref:UPF0102 protein J0H12_01500 n=1 Tax=Candidatus Paracaedimonas acanthamoebae TaxID=244581 RepID=A0A8J7PWU3_9PROT|nr:YraN family protein [Candidatus Paracaedimonas acanthamoebae]
MVSFQDILHKNVSRETNSNGSSSHCKHTNKVHRKIQAERKGRWAERISRILLRLKGYQILETRYKTPVGEIDIIAKRRKILAIIEVKARSTEALALESLQKTQQQRIQRAATWFLTKNPKLTGLQVRFDIILVLPWRWTHLQNMWII